MSTRYAHGSHFESCPAATGECGQAEPCGTYPDGAHRCRLERGTVDPHYRHQCLCGSQWICLSSDAFDDQQIMAALTPARHAA
jgi:hypothetical protein